MRNGELIGSRGGVVGTILRGTNRLTRTNLLSVISDKDKHLAGRSGNGSTVSANSINAAIRRILIRRTDHEHIAGMESIKSRK